VLWMSDNSPSAVGISSFCEYAPLVFSPLIGVFVDRWDRKQTFVSATVFRVVILITVALSLVTHQVWLVYIGAFIGAIGTAFGNSATGGIMMQLVSATDRKTAVTTYTLVGSIGMMIGPALGTLLYQQIGPAITLLLIAALYLIASLLVFSIKLEKFIRPDIEKSIASVVKDMKSGLLYLWNHPFMRPILFTAGIIGMCGGLVNVLEVFLVTDFLHLDKNILSVLLAVQGAGSILCIPLVQKMKMPMEKMFPVSITMMGVCLLIMIVYPNLYVVGIGFLLFSLGNIMFNVANGTIRQTKIALEYQGRSISMYNMILMGSIGFFMLIGGWVHTHLPVQIPFAIAGLAAMLVGFILLPILGSQVARIATTSTN